MTFSQAVSGISLRTSAGCLADAHILAAARQLHRGELLLVVLLECRAEIGNDLGCRRREGLDICRLVVRLCRVER